jgi:L-lactate dehydrogenase complex protein LldE
VSFLTDVLKVDSLPAVRIDGPVTYHDSCSGLRELGIKDQPRKLLQSVGATVVEMKEPEICCGFGGTFCIKYPEISDKMVGEKAKDIVATGADTLLAGDLGCLLNMAGKLSRLGRAVRVRHVAEVLADMSHDAPPIGAAAEQA